jgi:hypothetical protein
MTSGYPEHTTATGSRGAPAHDERRLAGAGLIGVSNKRHRHRNLTITVLFARVPTSIAAAPRWSPTLPARAWPRRRSLASSHAALGTAVAASRDSRFVPRVREWVL